jgi:omega-amidase
VREAQTTPNIYLPSRLKVPMKLKLALGQVDINRGNIENNFHKIEQLTHQAAAQKNQLILFPELWSTGYDLEKWKLLASPIQSGVFARISKLARDKHIWIGGSLLEADSGKAYNTFCLYDDQGNLTGAYRKIHLFRLMNEHLWLTPGDRLVMIPTPWGQTGCAICYDLRFPEMFRKYAVMGAKMILLPAEWPSIRIQHWQTLLRARAIENQLFIIAVNRTGTSDAEHFNGHSMVINPWGDILLEGDQSEALLDCEIDLDEVDQARARIPILTDRRPDVYG